MFDRKDITADDARKLVGAVCWDDFVNNKIQQCNQQIKKLAELGYREARIDIWCKEQYVWNKIIAHFQEKGFEVKREWCGIVLKW